MPSAYNNLIIEPNSIEAMTNINNLSEDEFMKLSNDETAVGIKDEYNLPYIYFV